jgi:hypothetical protein
METPPFFLVVGDEDENGRKIHNADVPVRWCIDAEFGESMKADGLVDPHILLVSVEEKPTWSHPVEMQRQLVPVCEAMTYLRFTKAGDMRIYGWIIDGKEGRKELHKNFTSLTRGNYATSVFNRTVMYNEDGKVNRTYEGYPIYQSHMRDDIPGAYMGTAVDVAIPEDVFAKKPHPFIEWYVNMWHDSPIRDGCHFRKRAGIAFILKSVPFLVATLAIMLFKMIVGAGFTIFGFRKVPKWKYLVRPYKYPFSMGLDEDHMDFRRQDFIIWKTHGENGGRQAITALIPFTPVFPVLFIGMIWAGTGGVFADAVIDASKTIILCSLLLFIIDTAIYTIFEIKAISESLARLDDYITERGYGPYIFLGMVAFLLLLVAMLFYVFPLLMSLSVLAIVIGYLLGIGAIKFVDFLYNFGVLSEEMNDVTQMSDLLCPLDKSSLRADYKHIPKHRRSLRLAFRSFKYRICKPWQQ